jgi:hypothetical protein
VIDPLRGVFGMKCIPVRGFLGMNGRSWRNDALNEGEAVSFGACHGRNRAALTLAGDDHHAALARLVLGKPAVDAVLFEVCRFDITAEIAANSFLRLLHKAAIFCDLAYESCILKVR